MISKNFIRADLLDQDRKPKLYNLVVKYQLYKYKSHIYRGPSTRPNSKCRKLFLVDVLDRTYYYKGDKRYIYRYTKRDIYVVPYNVELLLL
jgi:hypothetical protein